MISTIMFIVFENLHLDLHGLDTFWTFFNSGGIEPLEWRMGFTQHPWWLQKSWKTSISNSACQLLQTVSWPRGSFPANPPSATDHLFPYTFWWCCKCWSFARGISFSLPSFISSSTSSAALSFKASYGKICFPDLMYYFMNFQTFGGLNWFIQMYFIVSLPHIFKTVLSTSPFTSSSEQWAHDS